jgi:hypothetical protein
MGILDRSGDTGAHPTARCVVSFLLAVLVAGTSLCGADGAEIHDDFRVTGQPLWRGDNISAGGTFAVEGKSVLPSNGIGNRELTLGPGGQKSMTTTGGCPCQGLFADGFESGDLSAWSASSGS